MLSTGCSAGGAGSLISHAVTRQDIAPSRGFMIDDSGPVFSAVTGGSNQAYPSLPLQTFIRQAWGLDNGPLQLLQSRLPGVTLNDLGSIYPALSANLPGDRLGTRTSGRTSTTRRIPTSASIRRSPTHRTRPPRRR